MDPLLFGHDASERLVAVHPAEGSIMRCYARTADGQIRTSDAAFFPFFHLADRSLLEGFRKRHWVRELSGVGHFRYLCAFEDWSSLWDAVHQTIRKSAHGAFPQPESYQQVDALHVIPDPVSQFLLQSGRTHFKEMEFNQLRRMQIDIETYSGGPEGFSNAHRPADKVILIAMSDNGGWEQVIDGRRKSEKAMLEELVRIVRERDPDVLEGHNILGFDLPYLVRRCSLHDVAFKIGRDGSTPVLNESGLDQPRLGAFVDIAGRHVIDTLHLVRSYDAIKRTMESHGLKYAARFFNLAPADRTYVEGEKISWYWDNDPAALVRYALDDVRETRALADHLSGSTFYLARMVPAPYGTLSRSGAASKIEAMMLRAYVRARQALPKPSQGVQTSGGYTDMFYTGVLGPIVHADVESLYPSIMLTERIAPKSDTLGVFLPLLESLTRLRLEAKRLMQRTNDHEARSRADALQSSYKILINSFYGCLGYSRALFNDYAEADRVTHSGQSMLRHMIEEIRSRDGTVVEVDTDGVFFVPPAGLAGPDDEKGFVEGISRTMPKGITVAFDGRYERMLSYRMKNYALLNEDGLVTIKGSSLVSRAMERFGREFLREAIGQILRHDFKALHESYLKYSLAIAQRRMDIRAFAKVESLRDSLAVYEEEVTSGRRNRGAAYEVARATGRAYRPGDRIAYYVSSADAGPTGFAHYKHADDWNPSFPDEDTQHYAKRLDEFCLKFREFFEPTHFRDIFSPEGLFPFSDEGIAAIVRPAAGKIPGNWEEEEA